MFFGLIWVFSEIKEIWRTRAMRCNMPLVNIVKIINNNVSDVIVGPNFVEPFYPSFGRSSEGFITARLLGIRFGFKFQWTQVVKYSSITKYVSLNALIFQHLHMSSNFSPVVIFASSHLVRLLQPDCRFHFWLIYLNRDPNGTNSWCHLSHLCRTSCRTRDHILCEC